MDGRINLGDEVEDRVTGFKGYVTGRAEYLAGCVRLLVERHGLNSNGVPFESQWLDEPRARRTGLALTLTPDTPSGASPGEIVNRGPTGGPAENPPARRDAPRP